MARGSITLPYGFYGFSFQVDSQDFQVPSYLILLDSGLTFRFPYCHSELRVYTGTQSPDVSQSELVTR